MDPINQGEIRSNMKELLDLATAAATGRDIDPGDVVALALPNGAVAVVNAANRETLIAAGLAAPAAAGRYTMHDMESLLDFIEEFHLPQQTNVYVSPTSDRVEVVIDDMPNEVRESRDKDGQTTQRRGAWGVLRAIYPLTRTRELSAWKSNDRKAMDQAAFSDFIEDHALYIVKPDAATFLEIATTIQYTTNASFKSGIRLSDGQVQFGYEEVLEGRAGKAGNLKMPTEFQIALAPFVGSSPVGIKARLRTRVKSAALTFSYALEQVDEIERRACADITETLKANVPATVRVFQGCPPDVMGPEYTGPKTLISRSPAQS